MNTDPTFPPLPEYKADWSALFWEPISTSGERITVAVAVQSDSDWHVRQILEPAMVRCMTGMKDLLAPVEFAIANLTKHLDEHRSLQAWNSPVSGLMLGPVESTHAQNLTDAVRMAVQDSAFFGRLDDLAVGTDDNAATDDDDRWNQQIEHGVLQQRPSWRQRFRRKLPVRAGARPTPLDYAGERYVANFSRIVPKKDLGKFVNIAKTKLTNLEIARSHAQQPDLFGAMAPLHFELLLLRPHDEDANYSDKNIIDLHEALLELEDFADTHSMRVEPLYAAPQAVDRLISKEAA